MPIDSQSLAQALSMTPPPNVSLAPSYQSLGLTQGASPQDLQYSLNSNVDANTRQANTPITQPIPDASVPSNHPVRQYLSNWLYQIGESAKAQAGIPTDFERQQAQFKNQLESAQTQYFTGKNQTAIDTANARADASSQNAVTKLSGVLAQHGYAIVRDEQGNITGTRPLQPSEMSGEALANVQKNSAIADYQKAAAAKAKADADVKMNPNNPTFKQNQDKINAQLAMAQQKLNLALLGNQRSDAQFQINNGVNPDGSPATIQGAGQIVGPNGETVGAKFAANVAPTVQSKNMAQMAGTVIPHLDDLRKEITESAADLGPFMGRISNAAINGFGTTGDAEKDRRLGKLFGDIKLATSAVARTHFGGKSGPQAVAYFNSLLDAAKTPEALQGVLDSVRPYMIGYQQMGTPNTNLNKPGDAVGDYLSKFGKKK